MNGMGAVTAVEAAGLDPKDYSISGYCMGLEIRDAILEERILCVAHHASYDCTYLVTKFLYDTIMGNPIPKIGDTIVEEGVEWSPASVQPYPKSDYGAYIELSSGIVGLKDYHDMRPDDPSLWENRMAEWGDLTE